MPRRRKKVDCKKQYQDQLEGLASRVFFWASQASKAKDQALALYTRGIVHGIGEVFGNRVGEWLHKIFEDGLRSGREVPYDTRDPFVDPIPKARRKLIDPLVASARLGRPIARGTGTPKTVSTKKKSPPKSGSSGAPALTFDPTAELTAIMSKGTNGVPKNGTDNVVPFKTLEAKPAEAAAEKPAEAKAQA